MSRLSAILTLPAEAMVPAGYVRELLDEQERERIETSATREETFQMWEAIATRNLCEPRGRLNPEAAPAV